MILLFRSSILFIVSSVLQDVGKVNTVAIFIPQKEKEPIAVMLMPRRRRACRFSIINPTTGSGVAILVSACRLAWNRVYGIMYKLSSDVAIH